MKTNIKEMCCKTCTAIEKQAGLCSIKTCEYVKETEARIKAEIETENNEAELKAQWYK